MRHYICTGGCGGESSNPSVCQAEECKKEGEQLAPCDCADGLHKEVGEEESRLEDKTE